MSSWYHVCAHCNTKWFQADASACCPRCGQLTESGERMTPPWQANADTAPAGKTSIVVNREGNAAVDKTVTGGQAVDDEARQEQFRQAYREQLRRMSCPGCGEGEPEF